MPDARKFSRERHRIRINRRESVEATLRATVLRVLRETDPTSPPSAVEVIAELTAVIGSQLLCQTQSTHRSLKSLGDDIVEYGTEFVEQIVKESRKESHSRIRKISAAAPPSEYELLVAGDWAGPVAGPTMIEKYFGIPRSTLYRWQKRNEVVWLNTRTSKKPVFPLRQFVDGRPENGIPEIVQLVGDPREAWKWLLTNNIITDNCAPLDKLLIGEKNIVLEAARIKFHN